MRTEIGAGSVLGFIPTTYPAGVVLLEAWDRQERTIVRSTALVDDIETAEEVTELEQLERSLDRSLHGWALSERYRSTHSPT